MANPKDLSNRGKSVAADAMAKVPQAEALRAIENRVLDKAMNIVEATLDFREVDPAVEEPPPEWFEKYGDQAIQRYRLARAGWMKPSEAPVGMKVAYNVLVGVVKARATEKAPPKLNIQLVQMQVNLPTFPEQEVEQ